MAELAAFHCLGVLIIDKFENLSFTKRKTLEKILDFFNSLIIVIGIPLIFIGTDDALKVLQGRFLEMRENQEQGDILWPKLSKDGTWESFLKEIWKYQWTNEGCSLTEELSETLFEESLGSVGIAVKLYALAQLELIAAGTGNITSNLVRKIAAEDQFQSLRPMLEASKSGDAKQIAKYKDFAF
ncbi:MAG TPA: hypothetical protein VN426_04005 [Syntrophomonadaceae bacterium]|nr:hypothetical protein [Syntrophomonadaceae bacterium]